MFGGENRVRSVLMVGTATWALSISACFASAQGADVSIPAQPLAQTLKQIAYSTGENILFSPEAVSGREAPAINGDFSAAEAVQRAIKGSDLVAQSDGAGGLVISRSAQKKVTSDATEAPERTAADVETITVTAEKRSEALSNVPMGVTALSGDELQRIQALRFQDYAAKVPGLSLIDAGAQGTQLVLRGITSGSVALNSPVATYIDETPYSAEGPFTGPFFNAPNLDTFDMQRIEVLKGPQGTLYGANALGGLLKYVTNAPDPSGFAAQVAGGASSVSGGGSGFDLHGMVNVPLADDAALRVVGYDDYYPGFIDDPSRGLQDINGSHYLGGRASLLFQPTANLTIRLNALFQNRDWNNPGDEDVNPNTFTPVNGSRNLERLIDQPGHAENQVYNVTINWDAGFANLISATSYTESQSDARNDVSNEFGALVSGALGGAYGLAFDSDFSVKNFTQEIRLASPDGQKLQWQVGGYLTNEQGRELEPFYVIDATTKTLLTSFPVNLGTVDGPVRYEEYAGFADLDYYIQPDLDVALGGRYSANNQSLHEITSGALVGPNNFVQTSSQGVFTYSGDVRWHFMPDDMLYGRIATGYVPGGPNDVVPTAHFPSSYASSTTNNYEVGYKGSWLDNMFTADVSAFLIDWHKIQLVATIGGFGSATNGGTAQSKGVEWSFGYVPVNGLTLNFNGAYTDAYLTAPTPASVGGQVGDRLPSSPLWETSLSAEYEHALATGYSGFVGLDWHFSGSRFADFSAVGPRQDMPSYNLVDLRAGVEANTWSADVYVKNAANVVAIDYVRPETALGGFGAQDATIYPARTIGVELTDRF
jgi:outer membrane receptor protein involved in Fe transport